MKITDYDSINITRRGGLIDGCAIFVIGLLIGLWSAAVHASPAVYVHTHEEQHPEYAKPEDTRVIPVRTDGHPFTWPPVDEDENEL